jgi:hypothetical protein
MSDENDAMDGAVETGNCVPMARARGGDDRPLVPQPHGGAIRPFPKGVTHNTSLRAVRKQALELLHTGTEAASRRLLQLAESDDERVAVIASTQVLDRTLGKVSDAPQGQEGSAKLDLAVLTPDERTELMGHLAAIRRLRDLVTARGGRSAG